VPAAGQALLEQLLTGLTERVPAALGAALAVASDQLPVVVGAVGAAVGASWLVEHLVTALRADEPVLVAPADEGGPGVVAVAVREAGAGGIAVALVLDRPPEPPDADTAVAALPGMVAAAGLLQAWAAERERAEQMVQMAQYRRVIEQAKGLVMAATGTDAAAAFATLARASQHFNVRLRNLAVALVEHVGGAPAEGPDDPATVVVPAEPERRAAVRMWAALGRGPVGGRVPARGEDG
jgi:hypothetical protein